MTYALAPNSLTDAQIETALRDLLGSVDSSPTRPAVDSFAKQFLDQSMISAVALRGSAGRRAQSTRFDLDCIYGGGPRTSPHLFRPEADRFGEFVIDDQHIEGSLESELHIALMRFHNAVLAGAVSKNLDATTAFSEARRLVRWHYQWLIVDQFLPQVAGDSDLATSCRSVLRNDPGSWLNQEPSWTPTLPARMGRFALADLLHFADVAPLTIAA